ncbi:MAG TPA: hypothetical protein VIO33_03875 [Burkholderiaceae bacterium]
MPLTFPNARLTLLAISMAAAAGSSSAQTATEAELARKLDQLAAELAQVKAQLAQMQKERAGAVPAPVAAASAPASAATTTAAAPAASPAASPAAAAEPSQPATVLSAYAELNYNRPTRASENAQADMRRFVLGYQHRFDAKTKVVTELEVEHGVSSADDPGEVEVEQAYVERQLTQTWAARAGLFLIPAGLLNENHEPTAYYGVERNFVETAIIPSTWREGGLQFIGNFDNGLTAQFGVTTSFDLNKWDATSTEGRESPLGSIHQEMALAKARDLAAFGALNWRGVPGLLLGGSLFTGNATHAQATTQSRITLWDLHARWTPGRWDLSGVYSRGTISNTDVLNAPLVGNTTLIPKSFDGWYLQGAYKVWSSEDYALLPFLRWEQYNTARSYADLGPGLTPEAGPTERVITLGANFQVTPQVVLKADYQRFRENKDLNRVNLGLGWSF